MVPPGLLFEDASGWVRSESLVLLDVDDVVFSFSPSFDDWILSLLSLYSLLACAWATPAASWTDGCSHTFLALDRIYHVDCKDAKVRTGDGRRGRMSSHLPWADLRRGWDFVSTGHGDVPWEDCFRALNAIGYDGPISIEWEDAGMDRLIGAPEALEYVRRLAFDAPSAAFDAAFSTK